MLSQVNVNGPADVLYNKTPVHVRKETSFVAIRSTVITSK